MILTVAYYSRENVIQLARAHCPDISIPGVVAESQFTNKAVPAYAEVPDALRHSASYLSIQRCDMAGENAHLLFLTAHDFARVHGHAVRCLHLRYPISVDAIMICA